MGLELATTSVVRFATTLAILVGTGICANPSALAAPPADSGKPAEVRFDDSTDLPAKTQQPQKDSTTPKKDDPPQSTPASPKSSKTKGGLLRIFAPKAAQGEPVQIRFEESVSELPPAKEASKQTPREYSAQAAKEVPKQTPKEYPRQAVKEVPRQAPKEYPTQAAREVPKQAPQEAPKPAPTQAPKEVATQAPKEAPKEAPIEAPVEAPKNEIHYDDQL